jgi:hypothetical protein
MIVKTLSCHICHDITSLSLVFTGFSARNYTIPATPVYWQIDLIHLVYTMCLSCTYLYIDYTRVFPKDLDRISSTLSVQSTRQGIAVP